MEIYENHVDYCKRHHMDVMDDYLASIGQQRKPIPKDGSSLFRCVSEQLFSTQHYHITVRESCVAHMQNYKEDFEHFVDDSFEEYLKKMLNPKERGDQLEISALSQLHNCDFFIYEHPGHSAKNVTENNFHKKIYLCHSGQKHYDSVYPIKFFSVYGLCQSIVSSILLKSIFHMDKNKEKKIVNTFRMLHSSETDFIKENKDVHDDFEFSASLLYEPSIGMFDKEIPMELQQGLAFKLPVSLDFARSLDPSVCRNVDYDFWLTIKRRQQYIDFAIAEGMRYCIGDRCLICLNIYSKPLVGHVQETSPNNGPITVFVEALGELLTVAIKNVKAVDFANCSRNEGWNRSKHLNNDGFWTSSRTRRHQKNLSKSGSKYENSSRSQNSNNNHRSCNGLNSYQQRKYGNAKKGIKSPNGKQKQSKNQNWEEGQERSKSTSKSNGSKSKWNSNTQGLQLNDFSPSRLLKRLSISKENIQEDSWNSSLGDGTENTYMMQAFSTSGMEWGDDSSPQAYTYCVSSNQYSQSLQQISEVQGSESVVEDPQYWLKCGAEPYSNFSESANNHDNENVNNHKDFVPSASLASNGCNAPIRIINGNEPREVPGIRKQSNPAERGPFQDCVTEDSYLPHTPPMVQYGQQELFVPYVPSLGPAYPFGPSPPVSARAPYTGSIAVFDCEGKEMVFVDEKNPFQYFYNLGVEYYRQLSLGNPRPGHSVTFSGSTIPPGTYRPSPSSLISPQQHPVGYIQTPTNFISPVVPQPSPCMPLTHIHPIVASTPTGTAMHLPVPPGGVLVQIPPPSTLPPPPTTTAVANHESRSRDESITPIISPNHDESCDNESCQTVLNSQMPLLSLDPNMCHATYPVLPSNVAIRLQLNPSELSQSRTQCPTAATPNPRNHSIS